MELVSKCFREIDDDKKVDVLHPKIGKLNSRDSDAPSIEMLSEKSKPNKIEQAALSFWGKSRQECDKSAKVVFDKYADLATVGVLYVDESRKLYDLIAGLYAGDFSFGEFNRRRYELKLDAIKKMNELKKADSIAREKEAEKNRQQKVINEQLKVERQTVLNDLLNKQATNTRRRKESETCGLLDVNCSLGLVVNGDYNTYRKTVNRINNYIESQEILWVKGEISAVEFASSAYDYHKNLLDMDSYDREEYLFYMKIGKAYDTHQISLSDSVYLIEKNNNQLSERRAANEPPRSVSYTCDSQIFGGVVTTKCR
jgi:hypothetical protein